jgi:hypothetical protein
VQLESRGRGKDGAVQELAVEEERLDRDREMERDWGLREGMNGMALTDTAVYPSGSRKGKERAV